MFLCLLGEISCVLAKYVYYGYPEKNNFTYESLIRSYTKRYPNDTYFQQLCNDAANAFSVINYENKLDETQFVNMSDYNHAFNYVYYDFGGEHLYTVNLTNVSKMVIELKSKHTFIDIVSNETDLSKSIPLLVSNYFDIHFINHIKLNTLYLLNCDKVNGTFEANNLISNRINDLGDLKHQSPNKIFRVNENNFPISIFFYEDNITLETTIGKVPKNMTINKNISLMLTPYILISNEIKMILAPNVTNPMSLNIYFDDPQMMILKEICKQFFDVYFYYNNGYIRNTTTSFKFMGEWVKVSNFKLNLFATEENQKFINTTGIPQNINYTMKTDELFNITIPSPSPSSSNPSSSSMPTTNIIPIVSSDKKLYNIGTNIIFLLMASSVLSFLI